MKVHKVSGMPGWIDIGSDACWEDHGGRWARKAKDGSWYVIRFDSVGDPESPNDAREPFQHYCDLRRVVLSELPMSEIASALRSYDFRVTTEGLVSSQGDLIEGSVARCLTPNDDRPTPIEIALVEVVTSYGLGAPLSDESSDKPGDYSARCLRAQVRRDAEDYMRDAQRVETALDKPCNAIGSTAREYGRGDIASALDRGKDSTDPGMQIMQKLRVFPTLGGGVFGEKPE